MTLGDLRSLESSTQIVPKPVLAQISALFGPLVVQKYSQLSLFDYIATVGEGGGK